MKPSITREKGNKWYKDKKNLTIILGIFIIGTMILSTFGYSSFSGFTSADANYYDYNEYKFIETNQGWSTYINNNQVVFFFGPRDLEDFQLDVDLKSNNLDYLEKVYISFNPDDNLQPAIQEFIKFIKIESNFVIACSEDVKGCENLPIKTCKNSTDKIGVIQFNLDDKTEITTKNTCINVKGNTLSMIKMIDKIALANLGIMR
ncbi:hypothetical protein HYX17_04310 [Candidatus Woesearchaeota archaeon]|nr:hypothetical protein [Candidatus Woesearchaeota archaeon]